MLHKTKSKKQEEKDLRTSRMVAHRLLGKRKHVSEKTIIKRMKEYWDNQDMSVQSKEVWVVVQYNVGATSVQNAWKTWKTYGTLDESQDELMAEGILKPGEYLYS